MTDEENVIYLLERILELDAYCPQSIQEIQAEVQDMVDYLRQEEGIG